MTKSRSAPAIFVSMLLLASSSTACEQASPDPDAAVSEPPDDEPVDIAQDPIPVPAHRTTCTTRGLSLSRAHGWPGAGLQLSLILRDDAGAPSPQPQAEPAPRLTVHDAEGEALPHAERAIEQARGVTALVLVPTAETEERRAVVAAARALIDALPEDESVVLWSGEPGLPLLADATLDRAHLNARISSWAASVAGPAGAGVAALSREELDGLSAAVARVDNPLRAPQRNLVLVQHQASASELEVASAAAEAPLGAEPVTLLRLHAAPGTGGGRLRADRDTSSWGKAVRPEAAAAALADHIAALRASSLRVGLCGVESDAIEVRFGDHACRIELEQDSVRAPGRCELEAVARDSYPLGEVVSFHFTPEERRLHDDYDAQNADLEFAGKIAIGPSPKLPMRAHFRGQTSLDCDRKSYSVNLQGLTPRRLFQESGDDELYLISMCKETHYYRQALALRILRELGLFPLEQRYVEVRVDEVSLGPYLLFRKPVEFARAMGVETYAVIRRRLDADDKPPEARYPDDPARAAAALSEYMELAGLVESSAEGELYPALRERMDIEAYLRFMAFHTYFGTGDYVDEIFFQASREHGASGSALYFRPIAWDADDLFMPCHHQGRFAHVDPRGLLYCAEGDLDRGLIVDQDLYARFVGSLSGVMERWTPERVEDELELVREELFAIMDRPRVCAAALELIEVAPAATDCEVARAAIAESMVDFVQQLETRAAELRVAIAPLQAIP